MGRIKKVATERHTATASPFISNFVKEASLVPLYQLPKKLKSFPQQWPFPRGDLYHWIALLDRFDHVLDVFNKEYGLVKGPQQEPFECRLLKKGDAVEGSPYPATDVQQNELDEQGFTKEGDRELVEVILSFTRTLLEHCGNRSLYASSSHLSDILNTTSLNLLRVCLRLSLRLAQRYQVARYKNTNPHAQAILLQNHYNINLDRLQKMAQPFPKPHYSQHSSLVPPSAKGKERGALAVVNPNDLVVLAKEIKSMLLKAPYTEVNLTYYDRSATTSSRPGSSHQPTEVSPASPTPVRQTSTLGPSRERPSMGDRSNTSGDVNSTPSKSKESEAASSSAPKTCFIDSKTIASSQSWQAVRDHLPEIPADSAYDLLNRVRIAKAFSLSTIEDECSHAVEVRLLAIANLACALSEPKFQERIGQADHEEPKRYHLAQQLCDLLQPAAHDQIPLSFSAETTVFLTIEALSKIRHKTNEISDCLQISQNHGMLYYELRKVVASLGADEWQDRAQELEEAEWREAVFDLTNTLLQSNIQNRPAERMVSAGIMSILVDAMSLRTARAEQMYEKILQFFDSFIHGVPTAFETLANIKGFDIVAELTSFQVNKSLESARSTQGFGNPDLKSKVVDYNIPYYQQSTLRQLFKFIAHMFEHSAGLHDRLLRNLVDSPQMLGALRNVIENSAVFGSNVWSGAVNIMTSFIHNEPTSFQVVAEAGLVKSLLQTVVPWELKDQEDADFNIGDVSTDLEYTADGELVYPTPEGILPVGETMCDIPTAFGAICLNENGMKMFQSSKALLKYMDIFVSPRHVRALEDEHQTPAAIGQAFDELSRHHPQLKDQIMKTVMVMVKRVGEVCKFLAERKGMGAKLWERTTSGISVEGRVGTGNAQHDSATGVKTKSDNADKIDEDRVHGVPFINACFKFLDGFFHNSGMCASFCEQGGAVYLLDLATSASNPHDLVAFPVFSKITQVLKSMCDAKPHLVLPSLIDRTRSAIDNLKPLMEDQNPQGAFATFIDLSKPQISSLPSGTSGTSMLKSLAVLHMLTHVLSRALAPPPPSPSRHQPQPTQLFLTLNFTDIYIDLVDRMSTLYSACLWQNLTMQKGFSDDRKQQTDPRPFMMRRVDANGVVELAAEIRVEGQSSSTTENGAKDKSADGDGEDERAIQNAKALRYLLSQAPMGIEAFFHALGQALTLRRAQSDASIRQHSFLVAEHIADGLARELQDPRFDGEDELTRAKYTVQVATACSRILLRNSHSPDSYSKEALSIVLNKFHFAGGFHALNQSLQHFTDVLVNLPEKSDALGNSARDVLTAILGFFSQVVKPKCIHDALQSAISGKTDVGSADFFSTPQMVVEVRNAVLPAISQLWESSALANIGSNHTKIIIDILRTILEAAGEDKALDRSRKATRKIHASQPEFKFKNTELLKRLTSNGYSERLAREALYRCSYSEHSAQEYCAVRKLCDGAPSLPIPNGEPDNLDSEVVHPPTGRDETVAAPEASSEQRRESVEMTDAVAVNPETSEHNGGGGGDDGRETDGLEEEDAMSDDQPLRDALADEGGSTELVPVVDAPGVDPFRHLNGSASDRTRTSAAPLPPKDTGIPYVTIEDLDEKRTTLREDLIDRCLEVLSEQPDVTFDLSDLIHAGIAKGGEAASTRAEIGTTLVNSLLSLQGGEPSKEYGAKVAAYAHLVALILQDSEFFKATLDELKECFDALVAWIQVEQYQKAEDMPWIEMILLILERVLAEDEQPTAITWTAPPPDDPLKPLPEMKAPAVVVPQESKTMLFDALLELLPKVGKNSSLALSVSRTLVILTRRRDMALRLSEKASMSRLFLMIRQLRDSVDDKLSACFMIILRHMVEDEKILRQIMRTEIKGYLENHRRGPQDASAYIRNLYHLVLRDPDLFAKVTEELVEVSKFDGNPNRGQNLVLKKDKADPPSQAHSALSADQTEADAKAPTSIEAESADASKAAETKAPTVEVTDGVVQFLLRELSNYRDIEDKAMSSAKELGSLAQANGDSNDVEMSDASASTPSTPVATSESSVSKEKPVFKPEEHTIYIYRCFILQCLAELLASYNRTKIEFINFSRKPDTQPATPSKPRAATLNYLLNALIPVGTLEHRDDITHRKKLSTSSWATAVVVSLCSKTSEAQTLNEMRSADPSTEDSDLTFVRKFVLEHALRAFREATVSAEPLDLRYSRLLALGDLFNRALGSKSDRSNQATTTSSSQQIGKLMYERNFIPALTSAIAELDLNFPNAKRTVKYLLGPLKQLTDLGVWLSQHAELSSSGTGTAEEEEISSATSDSDDDDDDREQTPDLYRNSTLGMFESGANQDEASESESEGDGDDEDEMFDHGYDEEMDFEGLGDHGDVVSDEDEDIDGDDEMGPIEGMPGDVDMDVDIVVEEDDEEDEDDMDDDDDEGHSFDEDDEELHDEDDFDHHMDEITGDDEGASMPDHDHDHDHEGATWEDDDEDEDDELQHDLLDDGGSPHGGPLDALARVVAGEDDFEPLGRGNAITIEVDHPDEEYFEDEMAPDEDDDEDQEIEYDHDVAYEPELEDDEDNDAGGRWDWDAPPPPAAIRGHHQHHRHGLDDVLNMMGGQPFGAHGLRTHRTSVNAPTANDEGMNPLLQRDTNAASSNDRTRSLADTIFPRIGRRAFMPRGGHAIFQEIVNHVAGGGDQAINIDLQPRFGAGIGAHIPPMFTVGHRHGHALIDMDPGRPWREQIGLPRFPEYLPTQRSGYGSRTATTDEAQAVEFRPTPTTNRWQEEARMLFGARCYEKAIRVVNTLLRLLIPAAMEAKRQRDKAEAERRAAEEKAREEEKKRLEADKAEREAREAKEREEREAREAEEARAREQAERENAEQQVESAETAAMEGVEASQPANTSAAVAEASAQPENPPGPRVTATLNGREIDITHLGIDMSYLDALPEDMREEVILGQLSEHRAQAARTGEQPTELSQEFLDALPPEMQRDLLRQEAADRRRRERQDAQRAAAEAGSAPAAQPEEMNNADFMAMLEPGLRNQILMETDETTLASFPEEIQREARALLDARRMPRGDHNSRIRTVMDADGHMQQVISRAEQQQREAERQRRPVAQMLDKAGIATLLRLMFVSLHHKAKGNLHSVLADACKNTQNRAEVISILLSILQDGTADVNAVERSFAQLSLRAKQTSAPRTPQSLKRVPTGTAVTPAAELSPLNIVQQCLATLNALSSDNNKVPSFFLTEHETSIGQKTKSGKKGKMQDTKAAKFPINALLTLLDRKLITENPGVMENLAALLNRVTRPLQNLYRKASEENKDSAPVAAVEGDATESQTAQPSTVADVQMGEASNAVTSATGDGVEASASGDATTNGRAEAALGGAGAGSSTAKPVEKKKHRDLVAPDVPDENIRLVVNIITARECPAKTMIDTLDVIRHLSYIPGAKEVFGRELVRQAQLLSEGVLKDLKELSKQIETAESDTSLQGVALANFSAATSKQQKLLRTVTALDHLCDPEQMPTSAAAADLASQAKLREEILATLYENPTFDKLWDTLSQCLTTIRQKGNMINVAAILLPLIESLMVVCRNSSIKEPAVVDPISPLAVSTPPPAAHLETLFFRFTEEHRKILNELIRTNPKLMNGKFAVLAKNSKVLEFDNKRAYFSRKVHTRPTQGNQRLSHPSLQLSVRREHVFLDSFKSLYYKTGDEVKYGKLNIRFHGEEGIDAGGVSREWFAAMARQMFNPDYALFNPVASDRTTFHPNSLSEINPDHLTFFKFIGRIIAKALYEGRVLDCHFSRAVYRRILGKSVSLKDMESLDLDYYKSLVWILENDITDITFETFSVDVDRFGAVETVDLIPDGQNIAVTEENKQDYVRLVVEHRLIKSVEQQLEHFLAGFYEIIPAELISIFNEQELELLISGLPEIDIDDWKNNTEYHNYQATSPQIQWFWRAVRSFDKEEKAKLLQFVTGTSKVPLNGFKELEGMNGFAKFNIHRDYSSKEKLPSSHTCFNQLDLPEYESYEHLRQQLYTAITAGSEYFGFA